uniref:hypothetical protein n=1 Tax=Marinobacterium profundum TaxID=1714300 RepID=UPI00082FCEDC|nr:hypothetical protein [Marinobacterium profundum]
MADGIDTTSAPSANSANSSGARRTRRDQGGFIITIELILIFTILVIGSLVGLVAIRDALFKYYVNQQSQEAYVMDDTGTVLGKAIGFDEHEAPRIFYIDRTQSQAYRALIAVRDDRFTGREPLYYEGGSCQGDPCIKSPSDEGVDSTGVDGISATGAVGYIYGLQGQPTYAIGRSSGGLPGFLFRETPSQCSVPPESIGSRWLSQKVVTGEPCESYSFELTIEGAQADCLINPEVDCACNSGYVEQTDLLAQSEAAIGTRYDDLTVLIGIPPNRLPEPPTVGQVCCPSGTNLTDTGLVDTVAYFMIQETVSVISGTLPAGLAKQYTDSLDLLVTPTDPLQCETTINLRAAQSVANPNDATLNALETLTPPFRMSLPVDSSPDSWQSIAPDGEGGPHLLQP